METRLARLEERTENMREDLDDIKQDVRVIRDAIVGARGGWKLVIIMATIATSIGAGVATVLTYFKP